MAFPVTEAELRGWVQRELDQSRLSVLVRQVQGLVPLSGSGSPESVVVAPPSTLYRDVTGGKLYVKETGAGNTGWVLK